MAVLDHVSIQCADFGPGLPEYHPSYYRVLVRDPDGNNVEAVCHNAE